MKPQTSGLVVGKPKHKVLREPVGVALNGKIQGFGGNAIEFGEVCIEHDLLAADQQYSPLDLNRQGVGEFLFLCHFCRQTLTETFPMRSRLAEVNSSLLRAESR